MQDKSKYLVVIDPTTDVQPALHRAALVARSTKASLELLVCFYNEYLSGDRLFDSPSLRRAREELLDGYRRRLEEMAEPIRKDGTVVTSAATWDHPLYEGIVRHAVECSASMVFKDTHHHSAFSRALLTNTDWNLARTCPVPLWLVKPRDLPARPTLVASIDPLNQNDKPAALDDEIIHLGKKIGQALGGDLHAFHSYDPRIAVATATANAYIPVSLPLDEIEQQMHDDHKKRFEEITTFHDVDDDKSHLVAGMAHQELPILANELAADVVIMGAVARNRLKRLFIGATAERTLEHLPCDLLIVKPDWFRTPVEQHAHEAA
ncbi:MAG: universal stress protein [Woeseiaceae bacterium]|nr:universal stress protein [Woeseiaceae bacterium]